MCVLSTLVGSRRLLEETRAWMANVLGVFVADRFKKVARRFV